MVVAIYRLDFGGGCMPSRLGGARLSFHSGGGYLSLDFVGGFSTFDGGLLPLHSGCILDSLVLPMATRDCVHGDNSYFGGY